MSRFYQVCVGKQGGLFISHNEYDSRKELNADKVGNAVGVLELTNPEIRRPSKVFSSRITKG